MVKDLFNNFSDMGVDKLSDLFDLRRDGGESDSQFRQKLRGTVDHYQFQNEVKIRPVNKPLKDITYEVTGYDVHLAEYMRKKGMPLKQAIIGTRKPAEQVLMGQLAKENPPRIFVDAYGNMWEAKD